MAFLACSEGLKVKSVICKSAISHCRGFEFYSTSLSSFHCVVWRDAFRLDDK